MARRAIVVLMWVTALCGGSVQAMGLLDAYRAALGQDASVRAGTASVQIAQERMRQAQAQLLPTVSLTVSAAQNNVLRTIGVGGEAADRRTERYDSDNQAIQLRQPVYRRSAWLMRDQLAVMRGDAESARDQELANVALRIVATYTEALLAQDEMGLAAAERAFLQEKLNAAMRSLAAGSGTRTDIDEVRARLDVHAVQELDIDQRLRQAVRELELRTGERVASLPRFQGALADALDPGQRPMADWMSRAEEANPGVRGARARVEASRLEVAKARSNHEPVVDAFAQVVRSRSETVTTPSSRYLNRTVGLQLNVPLYAGGATSSGVRQALAEQDRAEALLEHARRELALQVSRAYDMAEHALVKMRALVKVEGSSRLALQSAVRSREAGVRTLLDTLEAEQRVQAAQRDLAQARYAYLRARVALVVLAGEDPLPEITRQDALLLPAE